MRQLVIAVFAAAFVVGSLDAPKASAQSASADPMSQIYACADLQEPSARLACYDQAVSAFRSAETAGEVAVVERAEVEQVEREAFGFSLPSLPRFAFGRGRQPDGSAAAPESGRDRSAVEDEAGGLQELVMTIDRVVARGDGLAVFHMTNGQQWAQVEAQRTTNVRVGDEVTIRRTSFGGFILSPRSGQGHRVRRLQ